MNDALKIILKSYDGEKETEYDVSVISKNTNNLHKLVESNKIREIVNGLKEVIKEEKKKMDVEQ